MEDYLEIAGRGDPIRILYEARLAQCLHGVRNSLRSAIHRLEVLERQMAAGRVKPDELHGVKHQIQSVMDELDLLTEPPKRIEPVDVNEVARRALHMFAGPDAGITIRTDFTPIPRLLIDQWELMTAFHNLLSNAVHAVKRSETDRPSIRMITGIEAEREIPMVLIRVQDNGVGIAPEHIAEVGKRGFSTWGQPGLGMAIVKHVVDAYGGSIEIESKAVAGTSGDDSYST